MIAATKQEAREIILRGVETLLARHGYRRMTMDQLAEEVGIGKGTIYLYFPSKEELVLSHVDLIVERVCDRMGEIAAGRRDADQKLYDMLVERVMVRFDSVHPYRKKVGENLAELRLLLLHRRKEHFRREAGIVSTTLLEGRRSGSLRFRSALETATNMIYATNCMLPMSLTDEELDDREEVQERASGIAKLVIAGISNPE